MLTQRRVAASLLLGSALVFVALLATRLVTPPNALSLDIKTPCTAAAGTPATVVAGRLGGAALPSAALSSGCAQARWSGFLAVNHDGPVAFKMLVGGAGRLRVDGRTILQVAGAETRRKGKAATRMTAGVHAIAVEWEPGVTARSSALRVFWSRQHGEWQPLESAPLFPVHPTQTTLLAVRLRPLVQWLALFLWPLTAIVWAVRLRSRARMLMDAVRHASVWLGSGRRPRTLAATALALILLYGAALRLEALVGGYWPDEPPAWAERAVSWVQPLRPGAWRWPHVDKPYGGSDPAAYLRYARQLRDPYEPRVREPLFVMATKAGLWLTGGRDVGVSVASGLFSVLAIAVTYLLGAYAFSRWVGLGAALALAIERQAIAQSVAGFRDEAFAVFVVLTAWAALRLYRRGAFGDALLLGFAGGGAWLTRITTPTLLLPLWMALAVFPRPRPWRQRLERVAVAALMAGALMAPFMVNCAVRFGDPFYSINEHVVFYRVNSNLNYTHGMTVLDYLRSSFKPAQMADTVFIGYTEYPFGRKWDYGSWAPHLGPILAAMSIAGLFMWLFSPSGRILLLAHLATMFAFAFTYEAREGGPWRLTFHAYPFYLIAAACTGFWMLRLPISPAARDRLHAWLSRRRGLSVGALGCALAVASWLLWHGLHYLRFSEALRADSAPLVGVKAGVRDAFFFSENWSAAMEAPGWPGHFLRYSRGAASALRLPLRAGRSYVVTLGLDPVTQTPSPRDTLRVAINGRPVAAFKLEWHPEKMGRYVFNVPALFVADGGNRLTLSADIAAPPRAGNAAPSALALHYVMVRPAAKPVAPTPEPPRPGSYGPTPQSPSPRTARPGP